MPFPWAAAAAVASTGFNAATQASMNLKTRQWSEKMWNAQNSVNDANYWRDVEVNSPKNQRRMFEEAGLNPALLYDSGGGFQSSSSPSAPTPIAPKQEAPKIDLVPAVNSYYDARMKPAQLDNLTQATENAARLTNADIALKTAQAASTMTDTSQKSQLFGAVQEALNANISKTKADTTLSLNQGFKSVDDRQKVVEEIKAIKADQGRKSDLHPHEMELLKNNVRFQQFKAELNSMGFTEHDSVLWRLFGKFAGAFKANDKAALDRPASSLLKP